LATYVNKMESDSQANTDCVGTKASFCAP